MVARRFLDRQLVLAAALMIGLFGQSACSSEGGRQADASPAAENGDVSAPGADNEILMRLIAYKPDELTVQAGTSVTWKQQDAGFHTVTSGTVSRDGTGSTRTNPDGTFDSGRLEQGKSYSFTFAEAGTYEYFCRIHPATMTGKVTAE